MLIRSTNLVLCITKTFPIVSISGILTYINFYIYKLICIFALIINN